MGRAAAALKELGAAPYRLRQIARGVFAEAASSYEEIDVLPLELRRGLERAAPILCLRARSTAVSEDGRARKAALELADGLAVESVLLKPSPRRWTACVSTQVGCAFGCVFCATGAGGFSRDLTAEEITDQVLFWRQHMRREGLEGRLDNVVYMGMGEPLANYDHVAQSLRRLMDQRQHAIGARHISVSTVGIPEGMERFGEDFPQVNMAVSLHAAQDELRSRLVPANRAYPLAAVARALDKYLGRSRRKILLEYALLSGVNDRDEDARSLIEFVRGLGRVELFHVNLILYNETGTAFRATTEAEARRFQERLLAAGLKATLRQGLGADIRGACGQLAGGGPAHG
ncbi:MAG: 23S rRNA (adenine(2503)-C(2))-methyltransferase RlmN [Elusimicrobia bacterium]|nr:23S rRNA (adenine(2503)-C(2))-methyltransferase RlmN [Elusimicrobiota bacterium]